MTLDKKALLTFDNLKAAFEEYDKDGNGVIDRAELKEVLAYHPKLKKCGDCLD